MGGSASFGKVIVYVLVANSTLCQNPASSSLVTMRHARFNDSPRPSHHYRTAGRPARRFTFRRCRVRSHQTSTLDRESLSPPCAQSPRLGSADRRILFVVDQAE